MTEKASNDERRAHGTRGGRMSLQSQRWGPFGQAIGRWIGVAVDATLATERDAVIDVIREGLAYRGQLDRAIGSVVYPGPARTALSTWQESPLSWRMVDAGWDPQELTADAWTLAYANRVGWDVGSLYRMIPVVMREGVSRDEALGNYLITLRAGRLDEAREKEARG